MTLLTVIQFIVAGLLGLITGLITEPMPDFSQLGADTWMSLIYITVFASCVALGLQNAAVARVDPAQAALFLATESVFGVTVLHPAFGRGAGDFRLPGIRPHLRRHRRQRVFAPAR